MPKSGRGELTLYVGNMASDKTGYLITMAENKREHGDAKVIAFKPSIDTRSKEEGLLESRRGLKMKAFDVSHKNPVQILEILKNEEARFGKEERFDLLVFDEIQFFAADSGFFELIKDLLKKGYDVLAAGLMFNFRGELFGSTPAIAGLAQRNCVWLASVCVMPLGSGKKCGRRAIFVQRFLHGGELAPYEDDLIVIGSEDKRLKRYYEPRCEDCFVVPPKKSK